MAADTSDDGLDYDFIVELPDEYQCSICLSLLNEPHLTACCGHHFCKKCINRVVEDSKPCPMCKAAKFVAVIDKNIERKLRALEVRCRFRANGCEWKGELRDLEGHIDPKHGHCKHRAVECPKGCGLTVLQSELDHHTRNICPNRDHQCRYCSKVLPFSSLRSHYDECPQVSVACPHGCSGFFPRILTSQHLATCPVQPVDCELSAIGCTVKVPRCHLTKHMDDDRYAHMRLITQSLAMFSESTKDKESLTKEVFSQLSLKDREIAALKETMARMQLDFNKSLQIQQRQHQEKLEKLEQQVVQLRIQIGSLSHVEHLASIQHRLTTLEGQVPVPPYYFTVSNFALHKQGGTQWTCPSFYSEVGGYKMAIEVSANGEGAGRDTHVSVYIRIMHGEHDDMLRWPLRASVTLQLISQSDNEAHYEMTTPQYEWSRVTSGVIGVGWGWDKFVPHQDLKYNPIRRTEYLKNDRLNFRVICVDRAY